MYPLLRTMMFGLSWFPVCLLAIGLGDIRLKSALNQPLDAEVKILDLGDTSLNEVKARLASIENYQRLNVEYAPYLSRLQINAYRDENKKPIIQITTKDPVDEPIMTFVLDLTTHDGDLLRQYTLFLDPPDYVVVKPGRSKSVKPVAASGQEASGAPPVSLTKPVKVVQHPASEWGEQGYGTRSPVGNTMEPEEAPPMPMVRPHTHLAQTEAPVEPEMGAPLPPMPPPSRHPMTARSQGPAPVYERELPLPSEEEFTGPPPPPTKVVKVTTSNNAVSAPSQPAPINRQKSVYGPVKASDTLWSIANQFRPNPSVAPQQVMVAIYRNNPTAFARDNLNGLKTGYMLQIPSAQQITSISQAEALQVFADQDKLWRQSASSSTTGAKVPSPTTPMATTTLPSKAVAPTKASTPVAPKQPAPVAQPNLPTSQQPMPSTTPVLATPLPTRPPLPPPAQAPLAPPKLVTFDKTQPTGVEAGKLAPTPAEGTADTAIQSLQAQLVVSAEALKSAREENKALVLQIDEMKKQNEAIQQSLQQKDQQIIHIQQQLATLPSAKPQVIKSTTQLAPGPLAPPAVQKMQVGSHAGAAPEARPTSFLHKFFVSLMLILVAAGGIGGAWYWVRRRREAHFDEPVDLFEPAEVAAHTEMPSSERAVEAVTPALVPEVLGDEKLTEIVDDVTVFIAYGRYSQAEFMLKAALQEYPHEPELYTKLLEVYAQTHNIAAFDQVVAELPEDMASALSEKIALLHEVHLKEEAPATDADEAAVATHEAVHSESTVHDQAAAESFSESDLPELAPETSPSTDVEFEAAPASSELRGQSLAETEIHPESSAEEGPTSAENSPGPYSIQPEEPTPLEDTYTIAYEPSPERGAVSAESAADLAEPTSWSDNTIEFDASPVDTVQSPAPAAETTESAADNTLEYTPTFAETSAEQLVQEPEQSPAEPEQTWDWSLDSTQPTTESPNEDVNVVTDENGDHAFGTEGELLQAERSVATKLDLARVYLDMDDHDEAQQLLYEVIETGDAEQKAEAEALLKLLDRPV